VLVPVTSVPTDTCVPALTVTDTHSSASVASTLTLGKEPTVQGNGSLASRLAYLFHA
jgi:hypothetical protein